jgi:TRAP-type C4-dicarboxylate transport system permease small subunit
MTRTGSRNRVRKLNPGFFEATEALMVVSSFMTIGYNQYKRGHIAVTLFTPRLSKTQVGIFRLISHFLSFVFFFLLAWLGGSTGFTASRFWSMNPD